MRRGAWAQLSCLAAGLVMSCALAGAQTAAPAAATATAQVSAYAVVGDLPGFLDRIGGLASKIDPQMNAQTVRAMAGQMVGDPTLAAFPAGSGAAVAMLGDGDALFMIEVSPQGAPSVEAVFKARGMQTARADKFVVAAKDAMVLDAAPQVAAQMKAAMGAQRMPMLVATVPVAKLMAKYDAQIKQTVAMFGASAAKAQQAAAPGQPQTGASIGKILDIEARVGIAMLKKIETAQIALAPSDKGLQIEYGIVPVGGMPPASPAKAGAAAAAHKLVSSDGAMRFAAAWDPKAMSEFITRDVLPALQEGGFSAADTAAIADMFKQWSEGMGDSMAGDMMLPGKGMQSGTMAVSTRDPNAALSMLEKMPDMMTKLGITEMYKGLGLDVKMSFKRNAREVKGMQVHQFIMDAQAVPGGNPQMAQMMKASISGTWDLAVVDNWLVYAMTGADIGQMIDAAKAKANPASKPLEAEKLFGAGGRFYLDYHVGRVLAMTTEMTAAQMPKEAQEAMKKMTAGLDNLAPVSMAGFAEPTRYRATLLVPADLIGKMAQNMRSMMPKPAPPRAQGMQEAPGMPGAPKPR